jgi:uncharacterized protein YndB with AHSA1/START domain
VFGNTTELAAPPQVVWEFMTQPGRRMTWQAAGGVTSVDEIVKPAGRRGVGSVNHCMHGADAMIEEILDWRPFDYFTERSTMPAPMGGMKFTSTYELEPLPSGGTLLHFRVMAPKKASDRKALEAFGPVMGQMFATGLMVLKDVALDEVKSRTADRVEPELPPARQAPDGFLAKIAPIELVQ